LTSEHAARSLLCKHGARTLSTCQNGTSADFSSRQNWSSEDFPYGGTVAVQKPLFTRGNHCSRAEVTVYPWKNHRAQWKMLFIHAARRSRGTLLPLSKLV